MIWKYCVSNVYNKLLDYNKEKHTLFYRFTRYFTHLNYNLLSKLRPIILM